MIPPGAIIGIIGGGQLGRMTALAAANLGYKTHIYTPEKNSPAAQVSAFATIADYEDKSSLKKFAKSVDVVTFEFENIPAKSVQYLEKFCPVRPGNLSLHISQNRLREKKYLNGIGVPTAKFFAIKSVAELEKAAAKFGYSGILKSAEFGYDGKGQCKILPKADLQKIWKQSHLKTAILEELVDFKKEISVIVARNAKGKTLCFPAAENLHEHGILRTSQVPANISPALEKSAQRIAIRIAENLELIGLLAVEFFVTNKHQLLVNEIAPRPHNSGHWTMDGCETSQFEQFMRAVCGLPFGPVGLTAKKTRMVNLLGKDVEKWQEILTDPKAKLHLYGKSEAKKCRKMGHVNYLEF